MTRFLLIVGWLLGITSVAGSLLLFGPLVLKAQTGHSFHVVETGSMAASGLPVGSLYLVEPVAAPDIARGDYILAMSQLGVKVMHEAVSDVQTSADGRSLLVMRGSSVGTDDPLPYDVTNGAHRVIWGAPGLGDVYTWLITATRDNYLLVLFAVGAGACFLTVWVRRRRAVPSVSTPSTLTTSDDESETTDDDPASIEGPAPALGH